MYKNNAISMSTAKALTIFFALVLSTSQLDAATIYARADGDWDQTDRWSLAGTGGASCSCVPGVGDDVIIDGYNIDVDNGTGNVTVNSLILRSSDRDDNTRFRLQNSVDLDVTTDITLFGNRAGRIQRLLISNSGVITVGGDVIIDQDDGNYIQLDIERTAVLDITDDLIIDKDGGTGVYITLNESAGTAANITVGDDFTIDAVMVASSVVQVLLNQTSSLLSVAGDFDATISCSDTGDELDLDLNGGDFNVTGAMNFTRTGDYGNIDIDMDGGDIDAGSLTFTSSGANADESDIFLYVDEASNITVTNDMTVTMTGGSDFDLSLNWVSGTAGTMDIGGNMTFNRSGGEIIYVYVYADDSDLIVDGDFSINSSGGSISEIVLDANARMQVDGDLNYFSSEGDYGLISLGGTGTPTLEIGTDLNIDFSGGNDFFYLWPDVGTLTVRNDLNLTNSGSGTDVHLDMDGGAIVVDRNFNGTLSGSDELLIDIDLASSISVGGDMTLTLGNGNDLEFHMGQNTTGSTATLNVTGNLLLDHNGGSSTGDDLQFIVSDDCIVSVGGDFTMDTDGSGGSGNFFVSMLDNAEMDIEGDFYMVNSTGSSYLTYTLDNSSRLELAGDILRNATPNNFGLISSIGSSTIQFDGSTAQVIAESAGAGTDGISYNNVSINNSFATAPQLTLEGDIDINGDLALTDGIIESTSSTMVNFADNATTSAASNASFIDGPVQKTGDDAFVFPTGDGGNYLPIEMTAPGATGDIFEVQYFDQNPNPSYNVSSFGVGIDHVSTTDYWEVNRRTGSSDVALILSWNANSSVDNLTSLILAGWDGTTWQSHGNGGTTGTTSAGTVRSVSTISTYNAFTFASGNADNPLPIELTSFDVVYKNDVAEIEWETRTEINNDFFTIERSVDGEHFEIIETIDGAGNSNSSISYFTIDPNPVDGLSYYRLKQTDFNGDFSYSNIETIFVSGSTDITIYPNPFFEEINITNFGDAELHEHQLFSAIGKLIGSYRNTNTINTGHLAYGVYFLNSYDIKGNLINTAKLVKK